MNSNSVCNNNSVKTLLCKKRCNVVISGPAFVWAVFALPILEAKWFLSGFYPRDCRYEPSEVRVKPHLPFAMVVSALKPVLSAGTCC